jgi:uncharacterized protein (TIGR00268 family)
VDALARRQERLEAILRDLGGVVVAYSGGVDSAYLLAAAHDVLGDRCLAATAVSPSLSADELACAERIAASIGARHVRVRTREFEDPRYLRNDAQRCYFCKHALFTELGAVALECGLPVVAYGANVDDQGDYRPGMRAAAEFAVRAPLLDAGLGKAPTSRVDEVGHENVQHGFEGFVEFQFLASGGVLPVDRPKERIKHGQALADERKGEESGLIAIVQVGAVVGDFIG